MKVGMDHSQTLKKANLKLRSETWPGDVLEHDWLLLIAKTWK
jgi:hypothetical protein